MDGEPLSVVDLFCGAGGFSLGFHAAGCRIIAAADADAQAAATYSRNLDLLQPAHPPHVPEDGNLEEIDLDSLVGESRPDVVIGGPPCQAFSRLGRAKLNSLSDEGFKGDPRNVLYRRFLAAVERWKPRAFVMENVPGMLSVGGVNYADIVCGELAEIGYRVGYALLNAVWYGVPQFRERLFFIGIRNALDITPRAPATTHHTEMPEGYAPPQRRRSAPRLSFGPPWDDILGQLPVPAEGKSPVVCVREAIDDLPALTDHLTGKRPRGDFRRQLSYRSAPPTWYATLMRNWPGFAPATGVEDHAVRRTPRDYETFRRMNSGDRYPEAMAIARVIRDEKLARLPAGTAPDPGTPEWDAFEDRFVPPYDEHEFPDKWRKLFPDRPSWTVPAHLAKDSYSHIHYDDAQARMISIREAARLQSFPDGFLFAGNMGDCFREIGNAVPPLLAWAVAASVMRLLGHATQPPRMGPFPSGWQ
jgi:DNA (cytosine-5)-methyltransferase 1